MSDVRMSGQVVFSPVTARDPGYELKVSVHHYLMGKTQVVNTIFQLHQTV